MRATYVADSTFVFEHGGVRVLTDPWIGTAIYGGSWRQYPPPVVEPEDIGRVDVVFISHVHEDHCDPATLRRLDLRDATLLVIDRPLEERFVERACDRAGIRFRDVRRLPSGVRTPLAPGLDAITLEADPDHELNHLLDSALALVWAGDRTLLFANDCTPHDGMIRTLAGLDVRFAALPASGGSGYPACYANLSPDEKDRERQRIVDAYLIGFTDAIERLRPRRFMACAGNHVLAGPAARLMPATTFLADPALAYEHAARQLPATARASCVPLPLAEGDTADLDAEVDAVAADAAWARARAVDPARAEARASFLAASIDDAYEHTADPVPPPTELERLFLLAAARLLDRTASRPPVGTTLWIDLGRVWGVVGPTGAPATVDPGPPRGEPRLAVSCDPRLLARLLTGRFSWNIADAGGLLVYDRVPNRYEPEVYVRLNHLATARAPETAAP